MKKSVFTAGVVLFAAVSALAVDPNVIGSDQLHDLSGQNVERNNDQKSQDPQANNQEQNGPDPVEECRQQVARIRANHLPTAEQLNLQAEDACHLRKIEETARLNKDHIGIAMAYAQSQCDSNRILKQGNDHTIGAIRALKPPCENATEKAKHAFQVVMNHASYLTACSEAHDLRAEAGLKKKAAERRNEKFEEKAEEVVAGLEDERRSAANIADNSCATSTSNSAKTETQEKGFWGDVAKWLDSPSSTGSTSLNDVPQGIPEQQPYSQPYDPAYNSQDFGATESPQPSVNLSGEPMPVSPPQPSEYPATTEQFGPAAPTTTTTQQDFERLFAGQQPPPSHWIDPYSRGGVLSTDPLVRPNAGFENPPVQGASGRSAADPPMPAPRPQPVAAPTQAPAATNTAASPEPQQQQAQSSPMGSAMQAAGNAAAAALSPDPAPVTAQPPTVPVVAQPEGPPPAVAANTQTGGAELVGPTENSDNAEDIPASGPQLPDMKSFSSSSGNSFVGAVGSAHGFGGSTGASTTSGQLSTGQTSQAKATFTNSASGGSSGRAAARRPWWRPSLLDRFFTPEASSAPVNEVAERKVNLRKFLPGQPLHVQGRGPASVAERDGIHGPNTIFWNAVKGRYHSLKDTFIASP